MRDMLMMARYALCAMSIKTRYDARMRCESAGTRKMILYARKMR